MLSTTMGQVLVNEPLPPEMRDYSRKLDKKGIKKLFQDVAERYPDRYRDIAHQLSTVAHQTAFRTGGFSFGLKDLMIPPEAQAVRKDLDAQVQQIMANRKLKTEEKNQLLTTTLAKRTKEFEDTLYRAMLKNKNPLAMQVLSGARGNPANLRSVIGGDLMYEDHRGRPIPVPILRGYAQGLRPAEYWASAFGTRKGVADLKFCVSADTEVLYADYTVKRIDQVKVGDWVLGANRQGHCRPVRVRKIFDNGLRPCYRYRFRKGQCRNTWIELVATEDHKVLAELRAGRPGSTYAYRSEYDPTPLPLGRARLQKNPGKNEFVAIPARGEWGANRVNEPKALLAGLMVGDGCMAPSTGGTYSLSCNDQILLDELQEYLAEFNLRLSRTCATQYTYCLAEIVRTKKLTKVVSGRNAFVAGHVNQTKAWLKYTLNECLAHEKTVPDEVWSWDDVSVGAFLGGLFSADGCIDVGGKSCSIKLNMTANAVVSAVQRLLELRLGIWTGALRYIPLSRLGPTARHDQFGIVISHPECIRRFAERVPLVGRKRLELAAALPGLSVDPSSRELGFKIYGKEFVGCLPTYDLEVDHPDHLFVLANGLIVSNSTQETGFFGKQLNQLTHRLLITAKDHDKAEPHHQMRGLPVDTDDPDNEGALLAQDIGPYKRNQVLTPRILKELHAKGQDRILIRSPIVGGPPQGGLYAADAGIRDRGTLPPVGDYVGMSAAQAAAEPITQAAISSKHTGGVAGAGASVSGFKYINQLVQVPKTFQEGATHAQADGKVGVIWDAPAGGKYMMIGGKRHYIHPNHEIKTKVGNVVEAGDVLSDGIPNPAEIVKHKGIGEGRRYFAKAFKDLYKTSGIDLHRRNAELIARGLINHVRLTDELGTYVPDDVVPYDVLEHVYEPRPGHEVSDLKRSVGKYLEKPVLHYSIGTKVRPSMLPELQKFKVNTLVVHPDPPPFEAEMIRGMESLQHDPDWMTRQLGSNLKKSLLTASHRGAVSNELGTSFVPPLSRAVDFGRKGLTKGWDPKELER